MLNLDELTKNGKYHDHNYNDCRILITNNEDETHEIILKNIIDIIIVACYYSNRYNNADNFLESLNDSILVERILFLKNNTQESIIDKFINSKILSSQNSIISIKNMLYLWKLYLEELKLPYIIPLANLKSLLKHRLKYEPESENFIDYTSNKIPFVSKFLNFWDDTIIEDPHEYYLEIDEICILFKNYCGFNKSIDIFYPISMGKKGEFKKEIEFASRFFTIARVEGKTIDISQIKPLEKQKKHNLEIYIDSINSPKKNLKKLKSSLDIGFLYGEGVVIVEVENKRFIFNSILELILIYKVIINTVYFIRPRFSSSMRDGNFYIRIFLTYFFCYCSFASTRGRRKYNVETQN